MLLLSGTGPGWLWRVGMSDSYSAYGRERRFSPSLMAGKGTIIDQLLVVLWLIVLPLDFPMAEPLRYPVAALMMLAAAVHYRDILPLLRRALPFFLLPGMAFLSILWADFPFQALRFGILMSAGMVIALYTAARLDHRQIVVCVFIAISLLCLASLANMQRAYVGGVDGGWAVIGVFNHKNVLGGRMVLLLTAALAILLDRRYPQFWRIAALVMHLPAWFLIFKANSATALLLGVGVTLMMTGLGGVWRPAAMVRGLRPAIAALALMLAGAGSLYLVNVERINPYTTALEKLGKDESLTGRTEIWKAGNRVIAKRPVLGTGAGSFWRPGVSVATQVSTRFHAENNLFYFHNAYYEVTVHLGFIGLAVFLFVFFRAFRFLIVDWWQRQKNTDPFFLTLATVALLRTLTESELFMVLMTNPLLVWTGVFLALSRQPAPQRQEAIR